MKKSRSAKIQAPDVSWIPALAEDGAPIYRQLITALEADMDSGKLRPGFVLPTQRALASALNVSPGTVTKASEEAKRLGLVQANVGRGTFINRRDAANGPSSRTVDLSQSVPGRRMSSQVLASALVNISKRNDLEDIEGYGAGHAGLEEHRRAFSRSLAKIGLEAPPENMVITNGAQHAMLVAIGVLCHPGDTVLVEAATYHGMKALAELLHLNLAGVAMDEEGLVPEALDKACASTKARVLYTMPTLQNPTARTMSLQRRKAIVEVARKRDVSLVEDDVFGFLSADGFPPLAQLAPERTFYINSVSKCVLPALRIGVLLAPPQSLQRVYRAMRASSWMGSPLAAQIAATWMDDGTVAEFVDGLRKEATRRTELAREILGSALPANLKPSAHVWLEMPASEALRVSSYARSQGVVTPPLTALVVDESLACGLRLSIGAPDRIEDLEWALKVIAQGIADDGHDQGSFI